MNLFVARLSYNTTDDGLRNAFEAYGEVESARVIMDKETGRSRGFGFVEMPNEEEANSAMAHQDQGGLNESELDGRFIIVKEANKEGEGGGGRRSGGGGGFNRGGGGQSRGGFGGGGNRERSNRGDGERRGGYTSRDRGGRDW